MVRNMNGGGGKDTEESRNRHQTGLHCSACAVDSAPDPAFCDQMSKLKTCEHVRAHAIPTTAYRSLFLSRVGGFLGPMERRSWMQALEGGKRKVASVRSLDRGLAGACRPTFLSAGFHQHL